MNKNIFEKIMFLMLVLSMPSFSINGEKLLQEIDILNSFGDDFAFEMNVTSHHKDTVMSSNTVSGYVNVDQNYNIKSLLYFTAPNDVKDRKMLIEGKYIWAFFPKTKNLIRLSPLQILLGEVAFGDVLRIVYHNLYNIKSIEEVQETKNSFYQLRLELKENKQGENYYTVKLKVEKESLRIVYSEMLSSTGKIIKKVYYNDPLSINNKKINSVIKIVDGVNPEKNSILTYKKMAKKTIPVGFFNKEYLTKFRKYDF